MTLWDADDVREQLREWLGIIDGETRIRAIEVALLPPSGDPVRPPSYLEDPYYASPVAFEGAMGYGANATGGRGDGTIGSTQLLFVDNLNDEGPGSLRRALCETAGPRVIVPRVGGTVQVSKSLFVGSGYGDATFLGMLAPGGGIAVRPSIDPYNSSLLRIRTNNMIVRHARFRLAQSGAGTNGGNCVELWGYSSDEQVSDVILDHISASYAPNKNLDIWSNCTRITFQNCASYYPLKPAGGGGVLNFLIGTPSTTHISLLYTFMSTGDTRFPYFKNGPHNQQIGCVVYNAKDDAHYFIGSDRHPRLAGTELSIDSMYNTFLAGPKTDAGYSAAMAGKPIKMRNSLAKPHPGDTTRGSVYLYGNNFRNAVQDLENVDEQWEYVYVFKDSGAKSEWRADAPHGTPAVIKRTAAEAYDWVIANAGASLPRDSRDKAAVEECVFGVGTTTVMDSVAKAGGYPNLAAGDYPTTNSDGIPDAWRSGKSEGRAWYQITASGRMVIEDYADDVAQRRYLP